MNTGRHTQSQSRAEDTRLNKIRLYSELGVISSEFYNRDDCFLGAHKDGFTMNKFDSSLVQAVSVAFSESPQAEHCRFLHSKPCREG